MSIQPGITWLSSSSAGISRARDVLKALTPGGVIDELGYLMLQAPFAEHFYPAVTTPMTRARYLIFIPAIFRHLEQSGAATGKDVDRVSRDLQYDLLMALLQNEKTAIGKEHGRALVRVPSDIYWNALGALGIATQRISEASYQSRLSAGLYRQRILKDDDDALHPDEAESLWNSALRLSHVMPDGRFPTNTRFALRRAEAVILRERYGALRPANQDNLITVMVDGFVTRKQVIDEGIDHAWEVPGLPPNTAAAAQHARRLSLLARGTTLQYNWMLIQKKGLDDSGCREAFKAWWERAHEDLSAWDVDAFFRLLIEWDATRRPKDKEFIATWRERCLSLKNGLTALDDTELQTSIRDRERYVRPGKERLRVKYQLDVWRPLSRYPSDVFYQLGYRHGVGRVFAQDIAQGLLKGAA